ncbi:MAG: hypothetical protein J2P18_06225 [Nocardia sp.]|nr:hypothetical protein [Nocardia sp.]
MYPQDPRENRTARYEAGYQPGNYGREYEDPRYQNYPAHDPNYRGREQNYPGPEQNYPGRGQNYSGYDPNYSGREYGEPAPYQQPPQRPRRQQPTVNGGMFIGGVIAAAIVTALAAWLCAWIISAIATRASQIGKFGVWNPMAEDGYWFAVVAFLCAIAAGVLWYLLHLGTPEPDMFFTWIVGILVAAAVIVPLTLSADLWVGISTAIEHLVIGLPILTLVRTVGARSLERR